VARQLPILFPVHPRTRARIESFGLPGNGIGDGHAAERIAEILVRQ